MLDACNGWPCCWHCQLASLACPGGHCQFVIIPILIIQTFALLRWWDFNFQGHKWESDKKTVLAVIVAIMDFNSIATYNWPRKGCILENNCKIFHFFHFFSFLFFLFWFARGLTGVCKPNTWFKDFSSFIKHGNLQHFNTKLRPLTSWNIHI